MPRTLTSAAGRGVVLLTGAAALVAAMLGMAAPAQAAASGTGTTTTASGLRLTVSPVRGLDPTGAVLRVSGKGYDPTVGIYVALCATPKKGTMPSRCGGGVNTTGTNPASYWISSNPPPYGASLAIPFRSGGRFSVRLQVSSMIGTLDCRTISCSIVTRADHTRAGDRRFDVGVRVRFASGQTA